MLKFSADHHFVIGRTHEYGGIPCQDYALSSGGENVAMATISDGCSSANGTDVGARLLAHTAIAAIWEHWTEFRSPFAKNAIERISSDQRMLTLRAAQSLGLPHSALHATSAHAYFSSSRGGYVHLSGDGVIALKLTDGSMKLTRFDWADNTPCYPLYALDGYTAFIGAHGGDLGGKVCTKEEWVRHPDRGFVLVGISPLTLREGIRGFTEHVEAETMERTLDTIAVFTDGVTQIDGIDWKDAVVQLLNFKTTEGVFAKRRLNRFVADAKKAGKGPLDDLAYAVIRIVRDDEKGEESDDTQSAAESGA